MTSSLIDFKVPEGKDEAQKTTNRQITEFRTDRL
jgi:hypothetical protein